MQHFIARQPYCVEDSPLIQVLIDVRLGECGFKQHVDKIAWETKVWIAEIPDHLIHFNGDKFLGPQ